MLARYLVWSPDLKMATNDPCLLIFTPLVFPTLFQGGLCDQQKMTEVTEFHFEGWIIKGTVASILVSLITDSGESQLPGPNDALQPCDRPTQRGTREGLEVDPQAPADILTNTSREALS